MDKKHRGSFSELTASAWLLGQGYEVFRNVSQHGPADLVALDPATRELILIDVKTALIKRRARADGSVDEKTYPYAAKGATTEQRALGVRFLLVDQAGNCSWIE